MGGNDAHSLLIINGSNISIDTRFLFVELYLKVDPKIGRAAIMKLVKKVLQELEGGSSAFNGQDLSPKLEYNTILGELH